MADDKEDGEKLFSTEKVTNAQPQEATKFIPEVETKNGVSPITVESIKSKFTGLTKEELMKYSKDPFWIRIRWTLFILFWIIWFIMLFGAITVIIVTPKCKQDDPPLWWQRSVLYKTSILSLPQKDGLVIDSLKKHIDYLNSIGVETLVLEHVLEANYTTPEVVSNFSAVMPVLKNNDEFKKNVIDYAKRKNVNIVIKFIPNSSDKNDLFFRADEPDLADVYVWRPGNNDSSDGLPNNWKSVYNKPAWTYDNGTRKYYLHQFGENEPEFNFRTPYTRKMFNDTLAFWLNLGVKGFYLDRAQYLIEDKFFENEATSSDTKFDQNQYEFYNHAHTFERSETNDLLREWNTIIHNHSGILCVSGGVVEKEGIADFVLRSLILKPNFTAADLKNNIINWISSMKQPAWEWKCSTTMKDCISENAIDGMRIISFLLPGTPVIELGQEFGYENVSINNTINEELWSNVYKNQSKDEDSHFNIFKKLVGLRDSPALKYGSFDSAVINDTVFAFTRIKSGNPGYLVAWNLGNNKTIVDFHTFSTVPDEFNVLLRSGNTVFDDRYKIKNRVENSNIELPPKAAIVFSFVPVLK